MVASVRMAWVKIDEREAVGAAVLSSQTADACVIVTSFSTPTPASTMPHNRMPRTLIPGNWDGNCPITSSCSGVRLVAGIAHQASAATAAMPAKVPSSAVVVFTEMPCAR